MIAVIDGKQRRGQVEVLAEQLLFNRRLLS
jgi:hypothetical protein